MSKSVALLLVLVFLTASCIVVAKPALSSTDIVDSWESKAPMHVARSGLGVAVVNGKIYAIGGTTYSGGSGDINGPLPSSGGAVGMIQKRTRGFSKQICLHLDLILV
jgi:hypothetical protein